MKSSCSFRIMLLCAFIISPLFNSASAYWEEKVFYGGTISGRVSYNGRGGGTLKVIRHNSVCGMSKPDEAVSVNRGMLKNVLVSIERVRKGKPIDESPKLLLNINCKFQPHILPMVKGQKIIIGNSDPILHSVHAYMNRTATIFNVAIPLKGQRISIKMKKKGIMNIVCDSGHTWMSGYIVVLDNPYFDLTGRDGRFRIEKIPPGTYKIRAWHEKLGTKTKTVTIPPGSSLKLTFIYEQ